MHQMTVDPAMKVNLDLLGDVPETAKALQPVLFVEGDAYCCVLGPDPQEGVFGCGPTPEAALLDWDSHLQERRETSGVHDAVAQYIEDSLGTGDKNFK
jgi:hypothetical protein